jgi:DUF4097 and DUF4098 domain-containing protein YvlB
MQHVFSTPEPAVLYVELGSGNVSVQASDVDQTVIEVTGHKAEEVVVEQRGHEIVVIAPKRVGFMSGTRDLAVSITCPTDSELATRLGSADVVSNGTLGWVKLHTGSGDITLETVSAEALVKAGSGDIIVETIGGSANLASGSGDIKVDRIEGAAQIATGSGDVEIAYAGAAVSLKSGSGDLRVQEACGDVLLSSGSGELQVDRFPAGKLTAKNASGDIRVGIPAGVPVWTDITSVTGRVSSTLSGAGQPTEGQDYVELRAKTVSGDVLLHQI